MQRQGRNVFSFSERPKPPVAAVERARSALEEPWSAFYTDSAGLIDLREAVAARATSSFSRTIDPESEVLVTVGAKEAIFSCLLATVDPGDEVLITDPAWVSYEPCIQLVGATAVRVPLHATSDGFQLRASDLEERVSSRSKLVILNSPHNPTGMVLDMTSLADISAVVAEHDLMVISDECYEAFVFDGNVHVSIASLPDMFERTVSISTSSKAFNMFGWRVGWAIGPSALIQPMLQVHQNIVGCAPSHSQAGVTTALLQEDSIMETVLPIFQSSRDVLLDLINEIPGVTCHKPHGAYFLFPDISGTGIADDRLADFLLQDAGVHVMPGRVFGPRGAGFVRLTFSSHPEHAREGGVKLQRALHEASPTSS